MARTELILGGQKSGKSRRAELLARDSLAQAPTHLAARSLRHQQDRAERVPGLRTEEEPIALGEAIARLSSSHTLVLVGNDIGLGVVTMGRETRAFVDALGRFNQDLAQACEHVTLKECA